MAATKVPMEIHPIYRIPGDAFEVEIARIALLEPATRMHR
jgi:hypothetical protein